MALLATFALLLQQLAFAAYACVAGGAPERAAKSASCADMSMPPPVADNDALCGHYCAQPTLAVPAAHTPTVPPLLMPALVPAMRIALPLMSSAAAPAYCAAPHPSPPPATILYCTLQI